MTDDDRGVEVAQLQSVMHRIQSSLRDVPVAQREYIANALLNLAVSRMLKEEAQAAIPGASASQYVRVLLFARFEATLSRLEKTSALTLLRLGDVVANNDEPPAPERAVDLNRING
jgi:hypothetical protein